MPRDVMLQLETGRTVVASVNGDPILTEGGKMAFVTMQFGAFSGGATTYDAFIQASRDGGANYYNIGHIGQLGPSSDDAIGTKPVSRPCYVPRPNVAGDPVRVRLRHVVSGATPSYAVTRAWLEPLLSLAPLDQDEKTDSGFAYLA